MRRTAFVTGAGRNIGRAIALDCARDGLNLVLVGRSDRAACDAVADAARELGAECLVLMGDIGDRTACAAMAVSALDRFGRIDVLVCNAAARPHWAFLETTDAQWDTVMDQNFMSAVTLARAFLPGMVAGGWGRIVTMTGMHAIRGAHRAPTVTSKHALWGLVKALTHEFAARGITANAISPGPIGPADPAPEPDKPRFPKLIPMDRRGDPEEVAAVARMLISDAGGYVSGQMIAVNGGGWT